MKHLNLFENYNLPTGSNTYKVYHGTSSEFTRFDDDTIGSNTEGSWNGWGFYFSDELAEASLYGSNVLKAVITINKPLTVAGLEDKPINGIGFTKLMGIIPGLRDKKVKGSDYTYATILPVLDHLIQFVSDVEPWISEGHMPGFKIIDFDFEDDDYRIRTTQDCLDSPGYLQEAMIQEVLREKYEISSLPGCIRYSGIGSYEFSQLAIKAGYDGIIAENSTVPTGYEYVVFDANQIEILSRDARDKIQQFESWVSKNGEWKWVPDGKDVIGDDDEEQEDDEDDMESDEDNYGYDNEEDSYDEDSYIGDRSDNGLPFYNDCVSWGKGEMDLLHHLIDTGDEISREHFLSHVSRNDVKRLEKSMGYTKSFPMEKDRHVKYYTALDFNGNDIYYFVHSMIEYVFMEKPEPFDDDDDE